MNITHGVVNLNSLWPTNEKMRSVQPIQAHYVKISNLYAHVIILFLFMSMYYINPSGETYQCKFKFICTSKFTIINDQI